MDTAVRRPRLAAPLPWLASQIPSGADARRRLVEACRAELVWARADWLEIAGVADGWPEACLPHEQAASRVLDVWGHLHPLEDRLRQGSQRLRAQRRAHWDTAAAREDVQAQRRERRRLLPAFAAAAADYFSQRAKLGSTVSARRWLRQKARTASNLWRKAS